MNIGDWIPFLSLFWIILGGLLSAYFFLKSRKNKKYIKDVYECLFIAGIGFLGLGIFYFSTYILEGRKYCGSEYRPGIMRTCRCTGLSFGKHCLGRKYFEEYQMNIDFDYFP